MALPANPEQLNIGQLVAALAQANAQEFLTVVELLKTSNRGVDWRLLLGAITAENAVVAADAAAAASFAQVIAGLDRENNLSRFLSTTPRGHLEVVDPTDFSWSFRTRTAAAGSLNALTPQVAPGAGRRCVVQGGIWCVAAGAAAQGVLDLDVTANNGGTVLVSLEAAAVAGQAVAIPFRCNVKSALVNQSIDVVQAGAAAANTVQALTLYGYIE